ncbi:MAG: efflux RND transporter permease subunit [Candidatus Latescibacteria bacterium]|nr:efflux RND transporter permease subunit [Candidatus Latescibacterota bacterium]
MIHRIIEASIKNKAVVIIAVLIIIGLGIKYFSELPVDVYPDLNAPIVNVVTENHGMAPEDVETLITFPLESSFNSLPSVKRVRSNSALGISLINIEFEYGADIYFARQLVSEKLQLITPLLPEGSEPPVIGPISSMFADALEFTMKGENLYDVRDFAEWELKPRLQTVPGVSNVINFGGYVKQYHVLLDPNRMLNFGIGVREVIKALEGNNINSSGGYLLQGPEEKIIRGMGRIKTIDDIKNIVLKEKNGVPVYIENIADVEIGAFVRRGTAGENGEEVVAVTVQNQYNSNVLETIKGAESVLENIKQRVKGTITIETFYTQLDMIMKSINNVIISMIIGSLLVILVLYIFLRNVRSTVLVSLVIPLSGIIAFIFFKIYDLSINIMTLGGLAIGLGMIVDSSIIMVENIYRHLQERKVPFTDALLNGAREVGNPIFYATLILLAVFAPIFTLQGIEGKMFIPLTFAVSAAVFGSLVISLTITPVLASMVFRKKPRKTRESLVITGIKKLYKPVLNHALLHPYRMSVTCLMIIVLGVMLSFRVGTEFMPEMDESSLIMDVLLPPETSLEESSRVSSLISQKVSEIPEVKKVVRRTGRAKGAEHAEPVNLTESNVVLVPKEERTISIEEIKQKIRAEIADIPGVSTLLNAPLQHRINHVATGTKSAIAVKIFGENINSASEIADAVYEQLSTISGVTDLQREQVAGVPQLQIHMNREKIARYGMNVSDVSEIIEVALNGKVATELIEIQKRYEIFVRYKEEFRKDENKIQNLIIETPAGYRIPISEITEIVEDKNPAIVRRENALRRVMVQCNVSGRDMGSVVEEIKNKISGIELPEGYFITFGGTYENQIHAMKQLTVVLILTIIIVFCLLVASFRSIKNALLILLNIPLAISGGIIILYLTGNTFSVPSIVGFIVLIGIAVQDGIVLVSHINGYRKSGHSLHDAVIKGGNTKIRPVLMTTFTTLLGLVPLAVRNVTGSEIQKPLAFVIMFGLMFSTIITLVVLPTLYLAIEKER